METIYLIVTKAFIFVVSVLKTCVLLMCIVIESVQRFVVDSILLLLSTVFVIVVQ